MTMLDLIMYLVVDVVLWDFATFDDYMWFSVPIYNCSLQSTIHINKDSFDHIVISKSYESLIS